ncbi:MAG: aminotransferase class I/II-fold pyridoxal phosphate-dependent enzyme [Bacteroidota bacterium]
MPILRHRLSNIYTSILKPSIDFLFAVVFITLFFPLMLLFIGILYSDFNRHPFFYQTRIGRNEQSFTLIKFRTLKIDHCLESTTWFSRVLRSLSLDELPQLINVIKGEMSFVGPRPLLPEYLGCYTNREKQRHLVKPGLTGLAQLKMGNSPDWKKRMRYDEEYVLNVSFWLDFKLLFNTFLRLFQFKHKSKQDIEIIHFDQFARNRNRLRIYLSPPNVNKEDKEVIISSLMSGWVAPKGPMLDKFEDELSRYFHGKKVLLLNSGTSALHLSLVLAGVQKGDYVITSSMTFAACANVIFYQSAIPVFIDSEENTWNMDPKLIEEFLNKAHIKPKAIILTHSYGIPADVDAIKTIADVYKIPLIEDAAEALGSFYKSAPVGSLGDFGVVSFNGNKIITTSGGGALICDEAKYSKGLHLATQANRGMGYYDHDQIGYNYRLSNILAGLGLAQFHRLPSFLKKKKHIYSRYEEELKDYLFFPHSLVNNNSNYWLTVALVKENKDPTELINWLERENIESRRVWKPLHLHMAYQEYEFIGQGICEGFFKKGICLPSGSGLFQSDQDRVIAAIKKF